MPIPDASALDSPFRGTLAAAAAVAALLAAALYLPHLRAGFASEDFLILSRLSNESLTTTVRRELASPWLDLESVGFWRPVSTILLALELRVLGLSAMRLHALHLILHALNAMLVAAIAVRVVRPRAGPIVAAVIAALFAIHPFHPSAVLLTAAFATLHGATFSLLAILCFLIARAPSSTAGARQPLAARRRLGLELSAMVSFVAALGSYEASAVMPVLLLVTLLLFPETRRAALRVAPFFVLLAGWFAARLAVLGTAVGGYGEFRERLLDAPLDRVADLARLGRVLLHPAFDAGLPAAAVGAAVVVLAIGGVAAAIRGAGADAARTVIAGIAWTAICLAPFAFIGLVPANGRYAYLAVAGVLIVLTALAAALMARWPRAGTVVATLALLVIALDWVVLLRGYLAANDRASVEVEAVRAAVLRVASQAPSDVSLLIEGHPDFIKSPAGAPLAKVFQYGLAESLRKPFGPLDRIVVPAPATLSQEARTALGALPGVMRYRWNGSTLDHLAPSPVPPALALVAIDPTSGSLDATCGACASARLVVLTAVMPFTSTPVATTAGIARFTLPGPFLRGVARNQRGDAFFWIEERGAGEPTALSPIGRFTLEGDPLRGFVEAAAKIRRGQEIAREDARQR